MTTHSSPSEPERVQAGDYTAEQVIQAIYRALKARDMEAVATMMPLLAVKDPASAQLMLDVIDLAGKAATDV
jgi:hypothetical protein